MNTITDKAVYRKAGYYWVKISNEWTVGEWCINKDMDSSWCCWIVLGKTPPPKSWGFTDIDFQEIDENIITKTCRE